MARQTVLTWRARYRDRGLAGLDDIPKPGKPRRIDPRLLVELEQVDVLEVEPLGAVDGEDRDRVLPSLARPPLLRLLGLGDVPAQQAKDLLSS